MNKFYGAVEVGLFLCIVAGTPLFMCLDVADKFNLIKYSVLTVLSVCLILVSSMRKGVVKSPVDLPVMLFVGINVLSLAVAYNKPIASKVVLAWTSCAVFYFASARILSEERFLNIAKLTAVIAGTVMSIYGIMQIFGMDFVEWNDMRTMGSFAGNANFVAHVLLFTIPLCLAGFISAHNALVKTVYAVLSAIMVYCLFLSSSRGGWVGITAGLLFFIFFVFRRKAVSAGKPLVWLVIFGVVALLILLPVLKMYAQDFESIFSFKFTTNNFRLLCWKGTINMIRQYPLLGVGAGNYRIKYPLYRLKEEIETSFFERATTPHSDYLHFISELGLIGIGLFLWMMTIFYKMLFSISGIREKFGILLAGLGMGVTATLIHGLFDFNLHTPVPPVYLMLFLGILSGINAMPLKTENRITYKPKYFHAVFGFCAVAVSFAVLQGFASGMYHQSASISAQEATVYPDSRQQLLESAVQNYRKSAGLNRSNPDLYFEFAKIYENNKYEAESAELYEIERKMDPYRYDTLNNLGNRYFNMGKYRTAMMMYKQAIRVNPLFIISYNGMGNVYNKTGNREKAILYYQRGLKINPNYIEPLYNLGVLYFNMGKRAEAEELLLKVNALSPGFASVEDWLGKLAGIKDGS